MKDSLLHKMFLKLQIIAAVVLFACGNINFVIAASCSYHVDTHDSYGDGWNGGFLSVYVNAGWIGDVSASGFGTYWDITGLNDGDILDFYYTAGSWESENTYEIENASLSDIFSDGPTPSTGWVFSTTVSCPRPCTSCTPADNVLGVIGTVVWGYNIAGNCGNYGKWVGSFTGEAGNIYHFDLCPDAPGSGTNNLDIDIKVTDAGCTILAGVDGSCSSPSWAPNDFQWTCVANGTYYVILAPYNSSASHTCTGTSGNTFTMNYYKESPCSAPSAPASSSASIGAPANGLEHHINVSCAAVVGADGYDFDYSYDGVSYFDLYEGVSNSLDVNYFDQPNIATYHRARAYKCTPKQYSGWTYSSPNPIYTACDVPASPTVNTPTATTLNVTINAEAPVANPAITTYSIYCTTTAQYVQAGGTLGAGEVFQTRAVWGTKTVTGLTCNTSYTFYVKARNNDSDVRFNAANTGSNTTSRCCTSCTPEDNALGVIGTVVYGYSVAGNCGNGGKWVGSFTGETGNIYHFDLCPDAPGSGTNNLDIDIKVTDAGCTILSGVDGSCSAPSWAPNDFQWTCGANGTYYVILAPYSSWNSHTCTGISGNTFTMNYYKELACTAPGATTFLSHSNTTTSITWNWNAATGSPDFYEISLDGGAWTNIGLVLTYTGSPFTANTQHRLNARANKACGAPGTAMGDQWFYTSQNTPTSITFSSIVGNSITATANGTFPNQAAGVSGVYIRNSTAVTNSGWMTATTSWTSGGLSCGTTYSFYAKARNGDGDETPEIGPTNQATTPCPGATTLNNPFDNYRKTYNIDFDWTATPANQYNFVVDDNYSFASPVININQAGNTYTISAGLTIGYTYYWKVRASNDGGVSWGGFSAIRSFTYDSGISTADWYQNIYNQLLQGTPGGTNFPVVDNAEPDPPTDNSRIQLPP